MADDSAWPEHFPQNCPPSDAWPAQGEFFRLVPTEPFTEEDFESHVEKFLKGQLKQRFWNDECTASGLSLLATRDGAEATRNAVGPLRGHIITQGRIDQSGLVKKTSSKTASCHHTWWRPNGDIAWRSFTVSP